MEDTIEAAVRSYQQKSLRSLEQAVEKGVLYRFTDLFIRIAKEIDDAEKEDTSCADLEAYKYASAKQKGFLDGVLTKLKKPLNALEVIDVLEKWGIFSKHENISIWKENLGRRRAFSKEAENVARNLIEEVSGKPLNMDGRRNLLHSKSFAIDKANTKDADDAVSYDPRKRTVLIHIADPAEYVSVRSSHILIKEASKRILTIYAGERKLSLFPDEVSNNLFSLTAGGEGMRYAMTYEFRILDDGEIDTDSMQVFSSVIAKPVCLTHHQAGKILNKPSHSYRAIIHKLYKLALLRLDWRLARGASSPPPRSSGKTAEAKARLLVDEMMIAANVVAAKFAKKHHISILYRGVGGRRRIDSSRMSTFRGTRYSCSMYGTGTNNRDMEKGANVKLHVRPIKHVRLGVDEYVQATSPIRKFGDLIVNFQFNAMFRGWRMPFGLQELKNLENKILENERVARRVERRGSKYRSYRRLLLEGGKTHPGVLKMKKSVDKYIDRGHERSGDPSREAKRRKCAERDEQEKWVVFLKDVRCDIVAAVPFKASTGMNVCVLVKEVNPRTSYLDAHIWKA